MKMWKTDFMGGIKEVEVTRETAKKVYYNANVWGKLTEQSEMKVTQYHHYFMTEKEAQDYLLEKQKTRVTNAHKTLAMEEMKLGKLMEKLKS